MLLINEVLHMAKNSDPSYLLIKLNTIKAFDYLGWAFMGRLLMKIGFGPKFIRMFDDFNVSVASMILIQGKLCAPFKLKFSMR